MGLYRMGPPADLILQLASEFSIKNFVETGTYEGHTALWASEHFRQVRTVEFSEHYFEEVSKKYNHFENVDFVFGDSRMQLRQIVDTLESPAIFWLDAHWSGGETYGSNDQCPLFQELKIIGESAFDNYIFIDDARLFTSPPQPPHKPEQWSDITQIINVINSRQEKYIVIIEDVIIAVPKFAKEVVARYCQSVNAKLWEEYGRQQSESKLKKGFDLISNDLRVRSKKMIGKIYSRISRKR